jgi:hypothetical protein
MNVGMNEGRSAIVVTVNGLTPWSLSSDSHSPRAGGIQSVRALGRRHGSLQGIFSPEQTADLRKLLDVADTAMHCGWHRDIFDVLVVVLRSRTLWDRKLNSSVIPHIKRKSLSIPRACHFPAIDSS